MADPKTMPAYLVRLQADASGLTIDGQDVRDHMVGTLYRRAEQIADACSHAAAGAASGATAPAPAPAASSRLRRKSWDSRLDDLLTAPLWGLLAMLGVLGVLFWLTLVGANYPSRLLGRLLFGLGDALSALFRAAHAPDWLHGLLVLGMYRSLAWVVAVMLPPMAIFFPLFTLLEDFGYLPRVAFNLDSLFRRAGAHGKQSLTMSMGFGCNAAGVIACRVIDSPRERLIAIVTNTFVPCNGRFPTLIALASIFFGGMGVAGATRGAIAATAVVLALVLAGIAVTLLVSRLLAGTVLRGIPSVFVLELPPYRLPQPGRILVRSIFDRTLFVLTRAAMIAAPAGALVWIMANVSISNTAGIPGGAVGGDTILSVVASLLAPLGRFLGMDGYVLTGFLLGLPANEIVLPITLMGYTSAGTLTEVEGLASLRGVLVANGWTSLTALCVMLFSLLHFPCGTTLLTIYRETGSRKWTALAALLPTAVAVTVCALVAGGARLIVAAFP
ncbi:MAG: nucleoside recognition domain-containing protein [Bacillota bacterium]|nr:nucleoside recognition domain-containing protein [Bacillota bacterium]